MNVAAVVSPTRALTRAAAPSWGRRVAEAGALVAAWMLLGRALRLGANGYLVLGVPLAASFQVLVARRPLRAAWVRAAPPFAALGLGRVGVVAAALVAIAPLSALPGAIGGRHVAVGLWAIAGAAGAVGVVYAAAHASAGGVARDLRAAAAAAVPGMVLMALAAWARPGALHAVASSPGAAAATFGVALLRYVPISFALEEVVFRGVLDAHVARAEDGPAKRLLGGALLLLLWGLWHLPIVIPRGANAAAVVALAIALPLVHVLAGFGLTSAWRWRGTLLAPAIAHALVDATRNALLGG